MVFEEIAMNAILDVLCYQGSFNIETSLVLYKETTEKRIISYYVKVWKTLQAWNLLFVYIT